jgi:hypothetical protein
MPAESVKLFRIFRFRYKGAGTVTLWTDSPAGYVARQTWTLASASAWTVADLRCSGSTKGQQAKLIFTDSGGLYLRGDGQVYARRLGLAASDWGWHSIQIVPSSEALTDLDIPFPKSSNQDVDLTIPFPESSNQDAELTIPFPESSNQDAELQIPFPASSNQDVELTIPFPATPAGEQWATLPMDE